MISVTFSAGVLVHIRASTAAAPMKWAVLIAACVLNLNMGISTEIQRGLMFLPPTIGELGLSQKRAADKNPRTSSVEHRNFLRKSQAQSQNRYVSKRDSAGAVGTPASGKKQASITIRIAGGSNRYDCSNDSRW